MCGILVVSAKDRAILDRGRSALDTIRHRGPDDIGFLVHDDVAMGHTRLAILDLSMRGHQPMEMPDSSLTIVFNGEIYNHLELRAELTAKGHVFLSTSDTETLLHGYFEWGAEVLRRLNGIFAFAIHDRNRHELFVARDQLGVKPLYYTLQENLFVCASELKAITSLGAADLEVDAEALARYIYHLWSPGAATPLVKVRKLLPGHSLTLPIGDAKFTKPKRYYSLPFRQPVLGPRSEDEWIDALDERITSAVERQMQADVPVAFFLSGGLDSSLLVAVARKLYPSRQIKTYTIGDAFDSKEGFVDDLPYALKVADRIGVDVEIVPASVEIVRNFDRMIWHLDEPQADAAPLNVLSICQRARVDGYKVMIGGAGGDDLFSGYRRHQALRLEPVFRNIPRALSACCYSLADRLPLSAGTRRLKKLLRDADKQAVDRLVGYFGWIAPSELTNLFSASWRLRLERFNPNSYLKSCLEREMGGEEPLNQMLFLELTGFLVDHNLNYTDKLGMAAGVEVRVPYLDLDIVEFACRLPIELKMKGGTTKYLLRKVAERYLPREIIYRPKSGFGAPVREWITGALHPMVTDRLARERLERRGIFDPDAVWSLIERNRRGEIDASYIVWALLAIESWMLQFHDRIKE